MRAIRDNVYRGMRILMSRTETCVGTNEQLGKLTRELRKMGKEQSENKTENARYTLPNYLAF